MKTTSLKASLLAVSIAAALATACSAAPGEGNVRETNQALGGAGDACDANTPCGTGFYCAPAASSGACGAGAQ
jgi:hypothetical protein